MDTFLFAFNAIAPILILIFIGWFLKARGNFTEDFFKKLNKLAFHFCFPCLMFINIYSIENLSSIDTKFAAYVLISVIILTGVGFLLAFTFTKQHNRRGVMIQAAYRSNFAVIGLPLAAGMAGSDGNMVTSMVQAPTVIYFNIVSVLVLTIFSDKKSVDIKGLLKNIVKNPLIQGLCAGLAALIFREFIPVGEDGSLIFSIKTSLPWLYTSVEYLGKAATPMCLLALGGSFNVSSASGFKKELISSVLTKLVLAPILGFGMFTLTVKAGWFSYTPAITATLIALYGSPIAVASSVMAQEMHADDALAGQIVVWTSFLSMISIFIWICVFRGMGLL